MNLANSDELLARLQALEQENTLLRQGVWQSTRMRKLWEQAITELQGTKQELQRSNAQLAVLYRVASAVNETLDLQQVLAHVMDAMEAALDAAKGRPMGIFLVDGERMRLAACRETDDAFAAAHEQMRVGDCLCGTAAARGELVVSCECGSDNRHTLPYRFGEPHGHLMVPLMARGKAVGVFYYYLPVGHIIDVRQQETFKAIGQQLGMAVEHAQLYEETRALSMRDSLTGLGNRRRMERVLDCELARVTRYQRPLSVLLIDIDFFKRYNDTRGHVAGDRLLTDLGRILQRGTRDSDLPVRYGGEEFLVILPETPLAGAQCMAERLRQTVAQETEVTISVGVADAGHDRADRDGLIQAADEALYRAKEAGRNRVEIAPAA